MAVRRIVTNIAAPASAMDDAKAFYRDVLDLDIAMDQGWIATLMSESTMRPQLSLATEGGSGTPVPAVSIEVDNLDEVLNKLRDRATPIEYGPVVEPWGVRRFYVRDPLGTLLNVLEHV